MKRGDGSECTKRDGGHWGCSREAGHPGRCWPRPGPQKVDPKLLTESIRKAQHRGEVHYAERSIHEREQRERLLAAVRVLHKELRRSRRIAKQLEAAGLPDALLDALSVIGGAEMKLVKKLI